MNETIIDERHAELLAAKTDAYRNWRKAVERETSGGGRRHDLTFEARDRRIKSAYNRHEKASAKLLDYLLARK